MKYFLYLLVFFILPGFGMNRKSSLYDEIGMHFKIAFPNLGKLLDDIPEESINKFYIDKSKCMLDL